MTSALSSPGLILPKSGSVPKFGWSTALISLTTTSASDDAPPWFSMMMLRSACLAYSRRLLKLSAERLVRSASCFQSCRGPPMLQRMA